MNIWGYKTAFAVSEFKDLLNKIRAGEKELLVRHEKDCLDRVVKVAVHLRHLEFMLKI